MCKLSGADAQYKVPVSILFVAPSRFNPHSAGFTFAVPRLDAILQFTQNFWQNHPIKPAR